MHNEELHNNGNAGFVTDGVSSLLPEIEMPNECHQMMTEKRSNAAPIDDLIPSGFVSNKSSSIQFECPMVESVGTAVSPKLNDTSEITTCEYICIICFEVFKRSCQLDHHIRSVHFLNNFYECNSCNNCFSSRKMLDEHMRIHYKDRLFKCDYCPKGFNQKIDLTRHIYIHSGVKPYMCKFCGKGYIRKHYWTTHMRTHK